MQKPFALIPMWQDILHTQECLNNVSLKALLHVASLEDTGNQF